MPMLVLANRLILKDNCMAKGFLGGFNFTIMVIFYPPYLPIALIESICFFSSVIYEAQK